MALKAGGGKQTEAELHRTYDNLTAAYSTEVSRDRMGMETINI